MGTNLDLLAFHAGKPIHGRWVMVKERTAFIAGVMQGERDHSCSKVLGSWMALGEGFSQAGCRSGSQSEGSACVHASDWLVVR